MLCFCEWLQTYRLSSLDYSRVLSHLRKDALAEAQQLQRQADAEAAAKAAAKAEATATGRFGANPWEGRAAISDSETPSSSSSSSLSTMRGRWSQRGWAERAAAAAAAGKPLAFLGDRPLDARREFEAQRRMNSKNSSWSQTLSDPHSESLSLSDSFLSPSSSDVGLQAATSAAALVRLRRSLSSEQAGVSESTHETSDEETLFESCGVTPLRLVGSREALLADVDYEPVEAHGFTSSCCGLKASVCSLRLSQNIMKRTGSVAAHSLHVSFDAAEAAVMAQSPHVNVIPCSTTDCTVLSVFDVNVSHASHLPIVR